MKFLFQFAQQLNINPGGAAPPIQINGPLVNLSTLGDLINTLLVFVVMPFGTIILFFVIVAGGYDVLMSQGEPEKMKSGRDKITTGLIGFMLLASSYFFVRLIGEIFGLGSGIF